jgi:hypothetical protein
MCYLCRFLPVYVGLVLSDGRDLSAGFTQRKHAWPMWRRTGLFAIICIPVSECSDNEKSFLFCSSEESLVGCV